MTFVLKNNFWKNARGVTFLDGNGTTWSFNANTNAISATTSGGGRVSRSVALWIEGTPAASEKVLNFVHTATYTYPAGLTGSEAIAGTASTGTAVWNINKNGSNVGTITFTASATGVLAMASQQTFNAGDILNIVAPSSPDATLADISITLAATG